MMTTPQAVSMSTSEFRVHGLDHVQRAMPAGEEALARQFFPASSISPKSLNPPIWPSSFHFRRICELQVDSTHEPFMAFDQAEVERLEAILVADLEKRRPPVEVRSQLDYAFVIAGRSVELHEIRPRWNAPTQKMMRPYAKATHVASRDIWKVYWLRADLKWHPYPPTPSVPTLEDFLTLVSEDAHACFYG
jgi:hypothetical protein